MKIMCEFSWAKTLPKLTVTELALAPRAIQCLSMFIER